MAKGGYTAGAGRKPKRIPVEELKVRLDVREMSRFGGLDNGEEGTLRPSTSPVRFHVESDVLVLNHNLAGAPMEQRVPLESVPCHYGSRRAYFRCPKCNSRRCLLYLYSKKGFVCRKCVGVVYPSQRAARLDRIRLLERKLERRLGPNRSRPRGMHFLTYERTLRRLELIRIAGMAAFVEMVEMRFGRRFTDVLTAPLGRLKTE